jgi:hypothetical protein
VSEFSGADFEGQGTHTDKPAISRLDTRLNCSVQCFGTKLERHKISDIGHTHKISREFCETERKTAFALFIPSKAQPRNDNNCLSCINNGNAVSETDDGKAKYKDSCENKENFGR